MNRIFQGDSLEALRGLDSNLVDCVATSPPYWGLRDYGVEGQLGLERRYEDYIARLCDIFDEVKRVLKAEGTCWVVMGDTYGGMMGFSEKWANKAHWHPKKPIQRNGIQKCLCQVPSRFAIEMCVRGWILRNEIIWWKPNCLPASVKDRFTVDYEKVFFFVKQGRYWFEQQFEPYRERLDRWSGDTVVENESRRWAEGTGQNVARMGRMMRPNPNGRNKRCVWSIPTSSFPEAHFAVFPEELIAPMIIAGCPEGGIVLDPFMGSGTTAVVARKLGRQFLGIELNPKYCEMAKRRIEKELGVFAE